MQRLKTMEASLSAVLYYGNQIAENQLTNREKRMFIDLKHYSPIIGLDNMEAMYKRSKKPDL